MEAHNLYADSEPNTRVPNEADGAADASSSTSCSGCVAGQSSSPSSSEFSAAVVATEQAAAGSACSEDGGGGDGSTAVHNKQNANRSAVIMHAAFTSKVRKR